MITIRELAKELGISTDDLLSKALSMGAAVDGSDAEIDPEMAEQLRANIKNLPTPLTLSLVSPASAPRSSDLPLPPTPATSTTASQSDIIRMPIDQRSVAENGHFALVIGFSGAGKSAFLDISSRCANIITPFDLQGTTKGTKTIFPIRGGQGALIDISGESFKEYLYEKLKKDTVAYAKIAEAFNTDRSPPIATIKQAELEAMDRLLKKMSTLIVIAQSKHTDLDQQSQLIASSVQQYLRVNSNKKVVIVFTKNDVDNHASNSIFQPGGLDLRGANISVVPTVSNLDHAFNQFNQGFAAKWKFNELLAMKGYKSWGYVSLFYPPKRYLDRYAFERVDHHGRLGATSSNQKRRWETLQQSLNKVTLNNDYQVADQQFASLVVNDLLKTAFVRDWYWLIKLLVALFVLCGTGYGIYQLVTAKLQIKSSAKLDGVFYQSVSTIGNEKVPHPYARLSKTEMQDQLRHLMFEYEKRRPELRKTKIQVGERGSKNSEYQALAMEPKCNLFGFSSPENKRATNIKEALDKFYGDQPGLPNLVQSGVIADATSGKISNGKEPTSCNAIMEGFLKLRWEIAKTNSDVSKLAPELAKAYKNIRIIDERLLTWYGFEDNLAREELLIKLLAAGIDNSKTETYRIRLVRQEISNMTDIQLCDNVYSRGWVRIFRENNKPACEADAKALKWVEIDRQNGSGWLFIKSEDSIKKSMSLAEVEEFCGTTKSEACDVPNEQNGLVAALLSVLMLGALLFTFALLGFRWVKIKHDGINLCKDSWDNIAEFFRK
jgi:Translation initiation factor IF-2, N-terminal region